MHINNHKAAKELVRRLSEDAVLLIAIRQVSERFSFDERIKSVFNDTYEAHGFTIVQSSVEYVLVLALMRIHDSSERSDVYSLRKLFDELLPDTEGANNLGDKTTLFEEARTQFKQLKESHLLARTKTFRDKFIAHLDLHEIMCVPLMDIVKNSVIYYYGWLLQHENDGATFEDMPSDLAAYYQRCEVEGKKFYGR